MYKDNKISDTMEDETGNTLDAVRVFSFAIGYLQEQLLARLQREKKNTIHWLIVVPNRVSENKDVQQFLIKAMKEADKTPETNVTIVSELDASVEFIRQSTMSSKQKEDKSWNIIVNLGGGYIDTTTIDINVNGKVNRLKQGMDGALKSGIDEAILQEITGSDFNITFLQFIEYLFGRHNFMKWKHNSYRAYLEMEDQIEGLKFSNSTFDPSKDDTTFFKLPVSLTKMAREEDLLKYIRAKHNGLKFVDGEIEIPNSFICKLFERTIDIVTQNISNTFVLGKTAVVLIGGMANSAFLQQTLARQFTKIVIPENPGLVVLKGAVYFGMKSPSP